MNLNQDLQCSAHSTLDLVGDRDLLLVLFLLIAIEDLHGEDVGIS